MPATNREVEIRLTLLPSATYNVDLRDINPASDAVDDTFSGTAVFDFDALKTAEADDAAYGRALSGMLFESPIVRTRFEKAFSDSTESLTSLHLRLFIDASATNLNNLRWELLRHPTLDLHLAASERVLLSRFVTTSKWNSVKRRAKSRFRALIAVANPSDLEDLGLKSIPVEAIVPAARQALAAFDPTVVGEAPGDCLTRTALTERLSQGDGYDILYLVCHGSLKGGVPKLYFQNNAGETQELSGDDFVQDLANLKVPPRLIVFASCESGARDGKFAEAALAPRLAAEAGIPAIVAMQAKISFGTACIAMTAFFRELFRDGQTDRAMAVARGAAIRAGARDAWVPALYSRLKDGRLWYTPGFGDDQDESALPWNSICQAVHAKEIVPVLGSDLADHILGSTNDLTVALAEQNTIPIPSDSRPDLPKIAQTIEKKESRATLENQCDAIVSKRLAEQAERFPDLAGAGAPERIACALSKSENDPFRILAKLDLKVYVSCAMDSLLKQFLRQADKFPIELFTTWRDESQSLRPRVIEAAKDLCARIAASPSRPPLEIIDEWCATLPHPEEGANLPDELSAAVDAIVERFQDFPRIFPDMTPSQIAAGWLDLLEHSPYELINKPWNTKTPIIYYAFGRFTYKKTWVLTQDDFFSYLIQHSSFTTLVPPMVSAKLASGSLLFLGFSLDDWTFRILLRLIRSRKGAQQLKGKRHIGVQIDPENYSPAEAARVKTILSRYLVDDAFTIDVYWGTSADFLRDLRDRYEAFKLTLSPSMPVPVTAFRRGASAN